MQTLNPLTQGKHKPLIMALGTLALMGLILPNLTVAKHGSDDRHEDDHASGNDKTAERVEFSGLIQARPTDMLQGTWLIGGSTFTTDTSTEFDQTEGTLALGTCAKVELRAGKVHEIDSEPPHDCKV